MISQIKTKD